MLAQYTQPPTNYIGSGLFLSYIVAALALTGHLALKIYHAHFAHPARPIGPAVAFLMVTFLVMSANMISVLVASYVGWARAHAHPGLGQWMLESSLFADFAADLGASPAAVFWAQLGLLFTLGASMWMAAAGRARGQRLDDGGDLRGRADTPRLVGDAAVHDHVHPPRVGQR
jgi:hypothetical protein